MARHFRFVAAAALVAMIAGCAGDRAAAPPSPRPVSPTTLPATALTPAIYVAVASNVSLFAIRASELAQTRAGSTVVRSTARTIAANQEGVAAQLSFAGRRLNLLPSATLPAEMQADLDRLQASADFDRDYRALVDRALSRALSAHETFARAGSSPTLKPVAAMAAAVTRRDLESVRR